MKKIDARPLNPETDAEDLLQLFDDVFGATITPDMWKWKYLPPWTNRQFCWVGEIEGRVIGYVGAVPLRGSIEGREVPFFQLADAMVHPKHRRRFDYFDLAARAINDDICATHPEHLLYGFSDHRAFLWFKRSGMGDLVEKTCTRFISVNGARPGASYEYRDWDWEDPRIDAVWSRHGGLKAGLVRDARYLAWRYGRHPVYSYRLVGIHEADRPLGWAVVSTDKPRRQKRPGVPVVDMLLPDDGTQPILEGLARHLHNPLKAWLPQRLVPGFTEKKETGTHVYHFVKHSVVPTSFLREHLYYTMGDVDWW